MLLVAPISDVSDIKNFIFGGRAEFSLRARKTGDHITFRVTGGPEKFRVSALVGPDNGIDFQEIGWLEKSDYAFRSLVSSPFSRPTAGFEYFLSALSHGFLPPTLEFWHTGHCGRCGRKLTDPESVVRGTHPVCAEKENRS